MQRAASIDEVIAQLESIIATCSTQNSRIGFFAVLYLQMTQAVARGINENFFEDGERMSRLDVNFANRYLDAWYAYTHKEPCSNAWCKVFDAAENKSLIVLQHLILGINTHINLDLALAAAATTPGEKIFSLKNDFAKINTLIEGLAERMQMKLEKIWWPLKFLKKISNKKEEALLNFSITKAREVSWANAQALAMIEGDAAKRYTSGIDGTVSSIAEKIISPGGFTTLLLYPVRWLETKDVAAVIRILQA
ncbi:MAG: hypothetical protein JWQ27_1635 [Ferruginibacter sp.]|nr:hypothetical protein [Ferruginibacter sp.]